MNNISTEMWNGKATMESYKAMAENNVAVIEDTMKFVINPDATAKFISESMTMQKEANEVNTTSANKVLQTQMELLKLKDMADAIKSWGEIYCNTSTSLEQINVAFIRKCIDGLTNSMGAMQKAKKFDDLVAIQTNMFSTFKETIESTATDLLGAFNSINSAIDIWTQKSLGDYTTREKTTPKIPKKAA